MKLHLVVQNNVKMYDRKTRKMIWLTLSLEATISVSAETKGPIDLLASQCKGKNARILVEI